MTKAYLLPFVLLIASVAYAAPAPEVCGDGFDNVKLTGGTENGAAGSCSGSYMEAVYGGGCDLKCPTPDQDNDGYATTGTGTAGENKQDCDDTDRMIYPGVSTAKGCSAGYYRKCQDNGTYTSCVQSSVTPLCEATGGGSCYYVSATGSDSAAGTYAAPFASLEKVSGGCSPTVDSPVILAAGDVVYLIGTGTLSAQWGSNPQRHFCSLSNGTSSNKITIKQYPGATVTLTSSNSDNQVLRISDAAYFVVDGLIISNGYGVPIYADSTDTIEIKRNIIYDSTGHDGNNYGAIKVRAGMKAPNIHHNLVKDYYGSDCGSGTCQNMGAIHIMPAGTDAAWSPVNIKFNSVAYSATNNLSNCGVNDKCLDCFHVKHGQAYDKIGDINIWYNTCVRASRGVATNSAGTNAQYNRFIEPISYAVQFYLGGDGSDPSLTNQTIKNNTIVASKGALHNWSGWNYDSTEQIVFENNVITDRSASYGYDEGMFRFHPDGTDAQFGVFRGTLPMLVTGANCYYNANAAVKFKLMSNNGTYTTGGEYSFSDWKSVLGYDTNSFEENPTLDSYHRATSTNCSGFGWLVIAPGGEPPVRATAGARFRRRALR